MVRLLTTDWMELLKEKKFSRPDDPHDDWSKNLDGL